MTVKAQAPAPPANLPVQLTSFIGRESEMAELGRLLRERRLVTIAGTAGLGKTRLAVEVAARLAHQNPAGTRFVGLGALGDPGLVSREVALALGVREELGEPLIDTLAAHVGSRRLLLLMDGCEHLRDASARLIDLMLRACPGLRVLATSQQALGLGGEEIWRLRPLAVPVDSEALEDLMQCEAVRLFLARSLLVRPDFVLSPANGAVVAQVCRRLDGIPLAIELAASRTETMAVEEILDRLEDRFRLLTGGARTVTPRHQTLRAALDWGHQLLDTAEQTLFQRLAVFPADFDLPAAGAVGAGEGLPAELICAHLTRLVDMSLVGAQRSASGPTRYRMLETVREYAAERLAESGEGDAVRRRHAAHYLGLAEAALRTERRPAQVHWLERLDAEHDNLRSALEWSRANDRAWWVQLTNALTWFWVMRGHLGEARDWLEGILAVPGLALPERAQSLFSLARITFWQGDYATARVLCERSLDLYRELNDDAGGGWARILLGSICGYAGGHEEGCAHLEAVVETTTDDLMRTDGLMWLAELLLHKGRLAEARRVLERSLELAARHEGRWHAAVAVLFLAVAALMEGRYAEAEGRAGECLELFHRQGNRNGLCAALDVFAGLAVAGHDPERALRLSGAAAAIRAAIRAPLAPRWADVLRSLVIEPARAAVGRRADELWAEATAMSDAEVVAYALGRARPALPRANRRPAGAEAGQRGASLLTGREREVAVLVARGMTNRQIAQRLVIAERTVEGHLDRVRSRLGVSTRTQIAVWVVEQGWLDPRADAATRGPT